MRSSSLLTPCIALVLGLLLIASRPQASGASPLACGHAKAGAKTHFDCSISTGAVVISTAMRGQHLQDKAYTVVREHEPLIKKHARHILKAKGRTLTHLRRGAHKYHRIRAGARRARAAGKKFRHWLYRRFPPARIRHKVGTISVDCGIGAAVMFVVQKRHRASDHKALFGVGGAIDGCLIGAISGARR